MRTVILVYMYMKWISGVVSGKRGSNPRPPAWEASALPTELLSQGYHLSRYPDSNRGPTHYECVALPTEPYRPCRTFESSLSKFGCKDNVFFLLRQILCL